MKVFGLVAAGILLLASCGGEIHFVSNDVVPPPPPPPPVEAPHITDRFKAGRATGRLFVGFVLYSSKTMGDDIDRLAQGIDAFLDGMWKQSGNLSEIRFSVMLDSMTGTRQDFVSPLSAGHDAWTKSAIFFFSQALRSLKALLDKDGGDSESPFQTFDRLLRFPVIADWDGEESVWTHFVYVRNHDYFGNLGDNGVFGQGVQAFKRDLGVPSLSPFRYSAYPVVYLSPDTSCAPSPAKLGRNLSELFGRHPGKAYELCEWSKPDLADLTAQIRANDGRWVLRRVPKLETLEFRVNGKSVPREQLELEAANNELRARSPLADTIQDGDDIEVRYEIR